MGGIQLYLLGWCGWWASPCWVLRWVPWSTCTSSGRRRASACRRGRKPSRPPRTGSRREPGQRASPPNQHLKTWEVVVWPCKRVLFSDEQGGVLPSAWKAKGSFDFSSSPGDVFLFLAWQLYNFRVLLKREFQSKFERFWQSWNFSNIFHFLFIFQFSLSFSHFYITFLLIFQFFGAFVYIGPGRKWIVEGRCKTSVILFFILSLLYLS